MKKPLSIILVVLLVNTLSAQMIVKPTPAFPELSGFPNVRDFTIGNDGKEAYCTLQSPLENVSVLVRMTMKKKRWSEPEMVDFTGQYRDIEPFLSPDGLKLYFSSNRPVTSSGKEPKDYDIWYVERSTLDSPWGKPVNLGKPVNSDHNEFYPSVADNNNLYFTSDIPGFKGKDDILCSKWSGSSYQQPVSLDTTINTEGYEFNAYVAPDESFLLFSGYNRDDGVGSGDLYISVRNPDTTWKKATNLGSNINTTFMDYCPFVDLSTKTLYFTSKRSSIVRQEFNSINDFVAEINRYENGMSRIYKVSWIKLEDIKSSGQ